LAFVLKPTGPVEEAAAAGAFFWIICHACKDVGFADLRGLLASGMTFADMGVLAADLERRVRCRGCGGADCVLDYRGPRYERSWTGKGPAPTQPASRGLDAIMPAECRGARDVDFGHDGALYLLTHYFESFRPSFAGPRPVDAKTPDCLVRPSDARI
jgi:hypothetical protein